MRKKHLFLISLAILVFTLSSCSENDVEVGKEVGLFPAYEKEGNKSVWGFIDENGDFKIKGQYNQVEDFDQNGVAKVYQEGKVGLINESGELILPIMYDAISEAKDGVISALQGNIYTIVDINGKILYTTDDYVFLGQSSDGYIAAAKVTEDDEMKMGYIDKNGKVLIRPEYSIAYDFNNGKALVMVSENKYALIDKKGKVIKELNYESVSPDDKNETFIFTNEDHLYGYLDSNGDVLVKPKFANAYHYEEDMAIVYDSKTHGKEDKWGVIDNKGKFIIKPKYTSIRYLGEGLFAVSKDPIEESDMFVKKAIINTEGKKLTDFDFYSIGEVKNKYISVSDGENTFLLDLKGNKATKLPQLEGMGQLTYFNNLIKASVDGRLSYYNNKGKVVWEEDRSYKLKGEGVVNEKKYSPKLGVTIYYPEIENTDNKELEKHLNEELYRLFVTEPMEGLEKSEAETTLSIEYGVKRSHDLLVIHKSAYYFMQGAAHGMPTEETYHVNLNTGEFYKLKDLFKANSNYVDKLSKIVKEQMAKRQSEGQGVYFVDEFEGIREDQNFILFKDYIQLYFYPYEVAGYAEGFSRFNIPYTDIDDIMNKDSDFWWAFTSTKKGN